MTEQQSATLDKVFERIRHNLNLVGDVPKINNRYQILGIMQAHLRSIEDETTLPMGLMGNFLIATITDACAILANATLSEDLPTEEQAEPAPLAPVTIN